jgi:hypothetical protein
LKYRHQLAVTDLLKQLSQSPKSSNPFLAKIFIFGTAIEQAGNFACPTLSYTKNQ